MTKSPTVSFPLEMKIRGADKIMMYLNDISSYDIQVPNSRYIERSDSRIKYTVMAKKLRLHRDTAKRIMKRMEEKKILAYTIDRLVINGKALKEYYLYTINQYDTTKMANYLPAGSIDVLFYLSRKFQKYTEYAKVPTLFSIREIEEYIGSGHGYNNELRAKGIINALYFYKLLDLDNKKRQMLDGNSYFVVKTIGKELYEPLDNLEGINLTKEEVDAILAYREPFTTK